MLASLGHQVGVTTCSVCHATHSLALSKEGSGWHSHESGSSSGVSLLKISATCGCSMGGYPRSPYLGCDQSSVSGAKDGGRESSTSMGCDQSTVSGFVSVSESELDSSKVTCLLVHMGLVVGTSWQHPQCGPLLGESVLEDWPADALYSSLNGLNFATASNCPNIYGHQDIPRKWSDSIFLYGLPTRQLQPMPGSGCPA